MQVVYLQPAQRNLARFQEFLLGCGVSKAKCDETIRSLVGHIRVLADDPLRGYSIGGRYGFDTKYRALLADRYVVIYEAVGEQIQIRRIYHMREDYLNELLPKGHPEFVDSSDEEDSR
ncbi:MAG: type II toxin-antitoxin system RelE/ParE family toxin [Eggerthellaceae bacterium]|nr:type II toxin-antitoxin system RelE/ParE family toxin [Eggerthellaceae bacterium]